MTSKKVYEAVLIEIHKENAPNITLEDFNYLLNKSIIQYANKRYNIYDVNQQTTDDLRVLKSTAFIDVTENNRISKYDALSTVDGGLAFYEVELPKDYLHLLNCICIYKVKNTYECYDKGDYARAAATRLTADAYSQVIDNFWNKPSYKKPYYYIHNINTSNNLPTNPIQEKEDGTIIGTDVTIKGKSSSETEVDQSVPNSLPEVEVDKAVPNKIKINNLETSTVQRIQGVRYGNSSPVRMEIRYGTDNETFKLEKLIIDYIKTPQHIKLTQRQIDKTQDESQVLEFPDYVCQEIINELVTIILEKFSDQRIQTFPVVSQSIAQPTQQQTPVKN